MAEEAFRVTYATLEADDHQLHSAYDRGIEVAWSWLDGRFGSQVDGTQREGPEVRVERSPIDNEVVVGAFADGTPADVDDAVRAARAAFPAWSGLPWQERAAILRRAAGLITERRYELAALVAIEVGKNRLEALGDVEESADLLRWNAYLVERHEGFERPMAVLGEPGRYVDVLRPYGVWGVISPFNFPMALAAGPASAALVAGNTVIIKPSEAGSLTALKLYEILREAGVPPGALHIVVGRGQVVGEALVRHPGVDGITFTGSYEVGIGIYRTFPRNHPKPVICEMGGKNAAIVTRHANLETAAEGVARSAFGFGGQKCSACSRVYVERPVYDAFADLLRARAGSIRIGNPLLRDVWLGPVIDARAVERFEEAVGEARRAGRVLAGGERLVDGDLARGFYVTPTVVEAPCDSWLFQHELFVPFVALAPVDSLDEALHLANAATYGLTAGLYSRDPEEVERFLDQIQAGVVYVNRRAGATTGAWPGSQPFGGWKGSGTTGKASGGPHYVAQYMREQSRTIIRG